MAGSVRGACDSDLWVIGSSSTLAMEIILKIKPLKKKTKTELPDTEVVKLLGEKRCCLF